MKEKELTLQNVIDKNIEILWKEFQNVPVVMEILKLHGMHFQKELIRMLYMIGSIVTIVRDYHILWKR